MRFFCAIGALFLSACILGGSSTGDGSGSDPRASTSAVSESSGGGTSGSGGGSTSSAGAGDRTSAGAGSTSSAGSGSSSAGDGSIAGATSGAGDTSGSSAGSTSGSAPISAQCQTYCTCHETWCASTAIPGGLSCGDFCMGMTADQYGCRMNMCNLVQPQPDNDHCTHSVGLYQCQ